MSNSPNRRAVFFLIATAFLNAVGVGLIVPVVPWNGVARSHFVASNLHPEGKVANREHHSKITLFYGILEAASVP